MKVPFVDLQLMHANIIDEMGEAVQAVVTRGDYILGESVKMFEEEFATYSDAKFAIGVDSGLSALKLALRAYDIGPGDEVIVPANTFIATAAAVSFVGAKPVSVEIHPQTYNIDPNRIEESINANTKAIIPVHLYGQTAEMNPIMEIAEKHNLVVIEDASQAHGARYHGKRTGSMGHIGAFSLYPAKNLGALGDGGVITTNDEAIVEKLKAMRNVGQTKKYHHVYAPYNHRLDTLHAAALRIKLRELDKWNESRRESARLYGELLADNPAVTVPFVPEYMEPVWHLYVIRVKDRDALRDFLGENGVASGIHYPIPNHLQEFYADLGYSRGDFPITEEQADEIVSLPMFPYMEREQVEYVVEKINEFTKVTV